jgi:hypothetical protein
MRNNTEQLATLDTNLVAAREELEGVNQEEALLEWEQSFFPQLQQMFTMKEPCYAQNQTRCSFYDIRSLCINIK